jgi:GTP diphosphokinase / guanosine-3',5'-bis(diphosphate) 3'-diphosphatase
LIVFEFVQKSRYDYETNMRTPINKLKFFENAKSSITAFDEILISRVWDFAYNAHLGQIRDSGEPYFAHPVGVASILLAVKCDTATIGAALLHDVIEDTQYSQSQIAQEFGTEIADLVDGISKLSSLDQSPNYNWTKEKIRRENLRKLFLSIVTDPRVAIVKLADRLHNLASLGAILNEERRKRIAGESLDVLAPLAEALGLGIFQTRIEDLAFRYLEPELYEELANKVIERQPEYETIQSIAISILEEGLLKEGINGLVYGRQKEVYSIYRKMVTMGSDFEQVYDIIGIRIIVDNEQDCYVAKHVVDQLGIEVEYDDYIAKPRKPLGYQSLHKVLLDAPGGQLIEVQIRSREMHERAEKGTAAHWIYKLGGSSRLEPNFIKRVSNLRETMESLGEMLMDDDENHFVSIEDLFEVIREDGLSDRISVFTPKGDIISLPTGSTPLDFAYHVHTELGHDCYVANVNGKNVQLDKELKDGDTVEIIKRRGFGPKESWIAEGKVHSNRAKQKIRQYFRKQDRPRAITYGKKIIQKLLTRVNIYKFGIDDLIAEFSKEGYWERGSPEELYLTVAEGRINVEKIEKVMGRTILKQHLKTNDWNSISEKDVYNSLIQNKLRTFSREDDLFISIIRGDLSFDLINQAVSAIGSSNQEIPVDANIVKQDASHNISKNFLIKTSECCYPVPGDEIVGEITIGHGLSIHKSTCPNVLTPRKKDRLLDVSWESLDINKEVRYSGELYIILTGSDADTFKAIQETIRKKNGIIRTISLMGASKRYLTQVRLVVDVVDKTHLSEIQKELQKIKKDVVEVRRSVEN